MAQVAAQGQHIPEFDTATDDEASDLNLHWWMNHNSRGIGAKSGVKYAEDLYYMDATYHLPGLKNYIETNARKLP